MATATQKKTFKMNRCACGKVAGNYATECKKCYADRMQKVYDEARRIVDGGKCPKCGAALRANYSLRGWWQCAQFGADGFREDNLKPSCNFQLFTE